jgi:ABC-type branched-subunit amino acid transport system ATPase component
MELGAIVMQDRPQALLADERLVAAYLGGSR